jgi:cell division protease FtsH
MGRDFGHDKDYSEVVAGEIDAEVRKIITENYQRAKELLNKNKF